MSRAGLYARVPSDDQQTLAMQNRAMREYAAQLDGLLQGREENSVAVRRKAREKLLEAARGEVKPPMFAAVGRREAPPCHYVQTW